MKEEQRRKFIINVTYWAFIIAMVYIALKYVLVWLLPFLFGLAVAVIFNPLSKSISQKFHLRKKTASVFLILLFYGVIIILFSLTGVRMFTVAKESIVSIPELYVNNIEPAINMIFFNIEGWIAGLDPSMAETVQNIAKSLSASIGSSISNLSSSVLQNASSSLSSIPTLLLGIVISVISSVFFSADYDRISVYIMKLLPDRGKQTISQIKKQAFVIGLKYTKGYLLLMSVTFIELAAGLSILGVENSVLIAAVIALLDLLPVIGTGGVVIPWIVIELILGNFIFALELTVLYLIITIVRNIIEPKIIGDQLGLHPVVMLICIYVGAKIFGVVGMFALPVAAVVLKHLYDNGNLKFSADKNKDPE